MTYELTFQRIDGALPSSKWSINAKFRIRSDFDEGNNLTTRLWKYNT